MEELHTSQLRLLEEVGLISSLCGRGSSGTAAAQRFRSLMLSLLASRLHAETNPLYTLRDSLKAQGRPILDLVSGNVNEHGILFPQDTLESLLAAAARQSAIYRPDPLGRHVARDAISAYYASSGLQIPSESIVLTPGTSLSYWYCFKLLADAGDEVLCPTPSYPLFDYIALLSGVKLITYPLNERAQWSIDAERLESSLSTRTRAIVVISPHNPTGHIASRQELDAIAEVARRHELAIISDEVFSEFILDGQGFARVASSRAPLVITLNGFSKMYALPGMKLGWMALSGDPGYVQRSLRALEIISDTFLPVNEVVQAAVPGILQEGQEFRSRYAAEIRRRWAAAHEFLGDSRAFSCVPPQGGFYLTLRLNEAAEDEAAAKLLLDEGLLVHPGYFYDAEGEHLVFSFVQEPELIEKAFPRLVAVLASLH